MKFSRISDWLTDFLHAQFKSFANRSGYSMGLIAIVLFCLSVLSWKLLLAIAFGIVSAWTVFELQQPQSNWVQRTWDSLHELWQTPNGKSIIAGSSGTLLLLTGFGLAEATGRGWIAATLILQGLTSAGVVAIWQQRRTSSKRAVIANPNLNFDRYIHDLTHPTLMRRLIAVKRLHHFIEIEAIAPHEVAEIQDYFQVLLAQETDPMIRMALQADLEGRDRPALTGSRSHEFSVQVREIKDPEKTPSLSAAN